MATADIDRNRSARAWGGWLSSLFMLGGVGLGALGGVMISHAWAARNWCGVGLACLLFVGAALLAIEGMQKKQAGRVFLGALPEAPAPSSGTASKSALPRLGEILVYKYHLVSEKDVRKALARQAVTGQRLGEILVEMRKLDWFDLAKALEDQFSYGDPWAVRR